MKKKEDKYGYLDELTRDALIDHAMILIDLLDARDELLYMIPKCPIHGSSCLPHARQWVAQQISSTKPL